MEIQWKQLRLNEYVAFDSTGLVLGTVEKNIVNYLYKARLPSSFLGEYMSFDHAKRAVEKAAQSQQGSEQ